MLAAHVIESIVVLIAVGVILSIALQRMVRSRLVRQLNALVSSTPGTRIWWDAGIPILSMDARDVAPAQAAEIIRQAVRCKLRYLELSLCNATDELATEVGLLSTLEKLRIADGTLTDAGVMRLAGLRILEVLQIQNCGISNASLNVIARFEQLEELSLDGTQLAGAEFDALLKLPRLDGLNLSQTGINDAGLEKLLQHRALRSVDVISTHCTLAFVEDWRASHPDSQIEIEI